LEHNFHRLGRERIVTNAQKTPISRSLSKYVRGAALDEISKQGLAPPGHVIAIAGAIVTVAFDVKGLTLPQVTMPLASSEYVRLPIQLGDKGFAIPASFYLGGVSGLGGGTATDTLQGNLSNLSWLPVGSKNFSAVDPNVLTLYGPQGVTLRDKASATTFKLTPAGIAATSASGSFSFSAGGHTLVINSTGVIIDGKIFLLHDHLPGAFVAGSTPVTGISGPVV
jgi:hypothetical protein